VSKSNFHNQKPKAESKTENLKSEKKEEKIIIYIQKERKT